MMQAVHLEGTLADYAAKESVKPYLHTMGGVIPRVAATQLVTDRGRPLERDVLNQGSAKSHVKRLQSTANGEDGQAQCECSASEEELDAVSWVFDATGTLDSLLTVVFGIHVVAA
jgi:hypothetical protein